jgi:Flp pilus assembly protein CpaB
MTPPARWTLRTRVRHLARNRLAYWSVACTLAVVTAVSVGSLASRLDDARSQWDPATPVVVALASIPAGSTITADLVALRELPATAVPDGALRELPIGRTAAADVVAGEVVVGARVAPDGLSGVAALLPPGSRAVAVPSTAGGLPPLAVGDVVDVLVSLAPDAVGDADPTFTVAEAARVVDVADDAVTVAVDDDDVARTAFAVTHGAVTLAVRTPGG